MIHDKRLRPVYRLTGGKTIEGEPLASLHLWHGKSGGYVFQYTDTVSEIVRCFPDAVRHVERRASKAKPRHPDVHYRPHHKAAWCLGVALNHETATNAVMTTDVSRVTCKHCLAAIAEGIKR